MRYGYGPTSCWAAVARAARRPLSPIQQRTDETVLRAVLYRAARRVVSARRSVPDGRSSGARVSDHPRPRAGVSKREPRSPRYAYEIIVEGVLAEQTPAVVRDCRVGRLRRFDPRRDIPRQAQRRHTVTSTKFDRERGRPCRGGGAEDPLLGREEGDPRRPKRKTGVEPFPVGHVDAILRAEHIEGGKAASTNAFVVHAWIVPHPSVPVRGREN